MLNNKDDKILTWSKNDITNENQFEFSGDKKSNKTETILPNFWRYQLLLFFMTQTGYFVIAGSMLLTTFLEPSKIVCNMLIKVKNSKKYIFQNSDQSINFNETIKNEFEINKSFNDYRKNLLKNDFFSLVMEWGQECANKSNSFKLSFIAPSLLMLGAVFGSFFSGFAADRFGRKPVVVGTLNIVFFCNIFIAALGSEYSNSNNSYLYKNNSSIHSLSKLDIFYYWLLNFNFRHFFVYFLLVFLGAGCGGYMVTNVVFLVEAIYDSSKLRLLAVALNGWPLGMIFTAIVGALSFHWRIYHLVLAFTSIIILSFLGLFSLESFLWYSDRGDYYLAGKIQRIMEKRYSKKRSNTNSLSLISNSKIFYNQGIKKKALNVNKYSYIDLFSHRDVYIPLFKISYCFFSSSVVSYGLFFSVDILPGNRYINLACMGFGKFLLGFLSYLISFRVDRRLIMIVCLGFSFLICCSIISTYFFLYDITEVQKQNNTYLNTLSENETNKHNFFYSLITFFILALTAILDPCWKLNHLYSIELFPTQVRNMSRGFCNVAARFGSLAGPLIILLRLYNESYPFCVFAVLLIIQWIISFTLSETKNKQMTQKMPTKIKLNKNRDFI